VGSCWGKQVCIFPVERNHMGIEARSGKGHAAHLGYHQYHIGGGVSSLFPCRCLKTGHMLMTNLCVRMMYDC